MTVPPFPMMITSHTYTVRLYLIGQLEPARRILEQEIGTANLWVSLQPTDIITAGKTNPGYVVELMNYPEYSLTPAELYRLGEKLLRRLVHITGQTTGMLVSPDSTQCYTTS